MAAKKKRAKAKPKPESFTAVKLVVHQASIVDKKNPGPYRYVVTGMIVSDHPLENFPTDNNRSLVMEDVEQGTYGFSLGSLLHMTLGGMRTREPKQQGMSADQYLLSLQNQ